MANWKVSIDVSEHFRNFDDSIIDDGENFRETKKKIIDKLKLHKKDIKEKIGTRALEVYNDIIKRLSKSKTLRSFNSGWRILYDWADVNLVWIGTF